MAVNGSAGILIKVMLSIFGISLPFMGYGIINNEVRNVGEHTDIRKEIHQAVGQATEKVDAVEDIVTDIRLEQREQKVIQKAILDKLK